MVEPFSSHILSLSCLFSPFGYFLPLYPIQNLPFSTFARMHIYIHSQIHEKKPVKAYKKCVFRARIRIFHFCLKLYKPKKRKGSSSEFSAGGFSPFYPLKVRGI